MKPIVRDGEPIRVLLVEDEFFIREWVAESLSEQGFAVEAVGTAADALQHLRAAPVDVLFTDVNLPGGMDGMALARCARELISGLAVVYASARLAVLEPSSRVPNSIAVLKPYVPAAVGRLLAGALRPALEAEPA